MASFVQYPPLGGTGGAGGTGGGGGSNLSFPLTGPPGSSSSITYGFTSGGGMYATADGGLRFATSQVAEAVKVDPSGAATFTKALMVQGLATLAGGTSTTTLSADSATIAGNASVGGSLGVSGSLQVTGDISARKVTASGDLSAASLSTAGPIAGATLSLSGKATVGSLEVKGTFKASQIQSDGPFYFPTASTNLPGLALADEHSTGLFAAQGGTIGLTSLGQVVLSFGANQAALFAGNVTMQGLTAGATTLDSLTVNNAVTFGDTQVARLSASGAVAFAGDLTVQGTTRLANLAIDHISTDHDLTVGGNAHVVGTLAVDQAATLASLTVTGSTALGAFNAAAGVVTELRIVGGDANYPPVDRVNNPNGVGSTPYVFVLYGDGSLSTSGKLKTLGAAEVGTTLAVTATATVGALATAGTVDATGEVHSAARLRAPISVVGGSTFATCQGPPNGQLSGSVGDQAIDLTSGLLYLKLSGNSTSAGWVVVTTQASSSAFPLLAGDSPDASHPQYAYSGDSRTGFGRLANGNLFLSQAGQAVVQVTPAGQLVLAAGLSVAAAATFGDALSVTGATTLAGLTAGATQLGTLSAGQTQLGATTAASATVTGTLAAGSTTLDSLQVTNAAQVGGTLAVTGAASSSTSLGAPLLLAGTSRLQAGNGDPNGVVTGSPGDRWVQQDVGSLWLKGTGTGTSGWFKVTTSATGVVYPLAAPDGTPASPSLGFAQGGLGITAKPQQVLVAVTNGVVGWQLDASQNFSLAAALSVAGATTLQGVSAQAVSAASLATGGTLNVGGTSSLQALTATSAQVASLAATGSVTAAAVSASGALSGGTVASGSNTWRSLASAPANSVGVDGDITSLTQGSVAFMVRLAGTWRQVALTGDAAPSQFPLRGPADSASAPNFAPSAASPGSGMYSPGSNQLGFSTNGQPSATVDASQNWTFVGAIAAATATLGQATVNGPLSVTGNTVLGGTLQVTGAVTLSSTLSSGAITSSGQVSAASVSASGAISGQSLSTSGDAVIGGNLTVNGVTTYNGVQRTGSLTLGDGVVGSPSLAFTSEPGLGAYKAAAGVLAFAVNGGQSLALAAALATFAGSVRVGGTNAGLTSPGANQVALQTAGTAALSVDASQNVSLTAKLTVAGLATGPTSVWSTSTTTPLLGLTESTAPATGTAGQLFVKSSDHNLYFVSSAGVTTQLTPTSVQFPLVGPIGSAAAPTFQVGSTNGLFATASATGLAFGGAQVASFGASLATLPGSLQVGGTNAGITSPGANQLALQTAGTTAFSLASTGVATFAFQAVHQGGSTTAPGVALGGTNSGVWVGNDAYSNTVTGITTAGLSVAFFKTYTFNSLPVYQMNLGVPTGTTTGAGLIASAQNPNGSGFPGFGGQIFQWQGGGAGASLYVNEATSGTSTTWAKILTSSTPVSPTFPLQSTTIGSTSSPAYGFAVSGYTTTGFTAVNDAGGNNIPAAALIAGGRVCAYADFQTIGSTPVYNLVLGDPTVTAAPYPAGIRAYANTASGNIIGAVGQLAINSNGGAGTVLAVKEVGVGTSSGWSYVYTQGTAQLAGQAGTTAAPYHSFSNSSSSGFSYNSSLGIVTSIAGTQVFNIGTTGAAFATSWVSFPNGTYSQPGVCFAGSQTSGMYYGTVFSNPAILFTGGGSYLAGFERYSGTNSGIVLDVGPTGSLANGGLVWSSQTPNGTCTASPGTIYASQAGTLWFKESGSQTTSGYAQVLTTSTNVPIGKFAYQSAAPAAVTSVGQVYALSSDGNLYYENAAGKITNLSAAAQQPASNTAPAATYTTVAGDSGRQFVNTTTTQSVITLYTVPSGTDYAVTFIVGGSGGFSITAPSSQLLYLGTTPATASTITSSTPGSVITLSNPGGLGTWYATVVTGTWSTG